MKVEIRMPLPVCEECTEMVCDCDRERTNPDGTQRTLTEQVWVVSCVYSDRCKYVNNLMNRREQK